MTARSLISDSQEPSRDPRLTPHFRALPIGGARKAFRLEEIYWEALEAIAERNGRTLAEEVAVTLARAGDAGNDAAALRASVTADLFDLWRIAGSRHVRFDWAKLMLELPSPAFAMTASQHLLAVNARLTSGLRAVGLGGAGSGEIAVTVDPAVITQIERKKAFLDCSVCFHAGGSRAVRRARLGPANDPAAGPGVMLGFVEP